EGFGDGPGRVAVLAVICGDEVVEGAIPTTAVVIEALGGQHGDLPGPFGGSACGSDGGVQVVVGGVEIGSLVPQGLPGDRDQGGLGKGVGAAAPGPVDDGLHDCRLGGV